MAQEICMPNAT